MRGGVAAQKLSGPAVATERGGGFFMGGFVDWLDKDADGKVSRIEFDGSPDAFDRHDSNGDGFLAEDEAPPPPSRGGGHRPPPHIR